MSLVEIDPNTGRPSSFDPRRQSQAESISTLWSSADVPLFLDTRSSVPVVHGEKAGLAGPIVLDGRLQPTQEVQEILSDDGASPLLLSDSTPRSSLDPVAPFPGTNSSPSSFAASRYGRKQSQDSPRRRPPPLQLQTSNTMLNLAVQNPMFPASVSHSSQLTMIPNAAKSPAPTKSSISPQNAAQDITTGQQAIQSPLPSSSTPVLQQRRSSLKKSSSKAPLTVPEQPVPALISPSVRNRLYAKADQFFQVDYSVASPTNYQGPTMQASASIQAMPAPPSSAYSDGSHPLGLNRKPSMTLSVSSESNTFSRENSMPGSLSHASTSSGTASSCVLSSDDGQGYHLGRGPAEVEQAYLYPVPDSRLNAQPTMLEKRDLLKDRKAKSSKYDGHNIQGYGVLPPTPQRSFHNQQSSPGFAPSVVSLASNPPTSFSQGSGPLRPPFVNTTLLGVAMTGLSPMVQSPMSLPTPVSSFSEASESGASCYSTLPNDARNVVNQWAYTSPSVSPTQVITAAERPKDNAARFRTVSASRLLHAASVKLLRNEPGPEVPTVPLPKGFSKAQRPSTATTDGCNLRPRARTVGDRDRPISLQPAPRIPEKLSLTSDSYPPVVRSPQGSLLPHSTMTTSSTKTSSVFRPKSKGGWASHLSGGLTLHIDQETQRTIQINLSYLAYDPFGQPEALIPPGAESQRPGTPRRSGKSAKVEEEDHTGILEFGPSPGSEDGWVVQNASSTSNAPMLRHITIGPDTKADVLTRQARLSLSTDGTHEVFGSEKKGRLGWRFVYKVEPCLDGFGRPVASGEKILRPLKFLCSATLLDPSRTQKSRLINLVRKQVNANLESTPVRSPASFSSQTDLCASSIPSPLASTRNSSTTPIQFFHQQNQVQQYLVNPNVISSTLQNRAYNPQFAHSTTSLASSESCIPATVQRLDASRVSVPANLPAGVVPFKIVRPSVTQAPVSPTGQTFPGRGQSFSDLSAYGTPQPVLLPAQHANNAAGPLPEFTPGYIVAAPVNLQTRASQPRLASFDAQGPARMGSFASGQPAPQHVTPRQPELSQPPAATPDTVVATEKVRRSRAHTSGETRLKRPLTASELIKREWEDKQKNEPPVTPDWMPRTPFSQQQQQQQNKVEASEVSNLGLQPQQNGGTRHVSASSGSSAEMSVLTPDCFGSVGERRRSRTLGARSSKRPFTADPMAQMNMPPLPRPSLAQLTNFGPVASASTVDGLHSAMTMPVVGIPDRVQHPYLHANASNPYLVIPGSAGAGTPLPVAAPLAPGARAAEMLQQMPTTIVQPAQLGMAPIPPKRNLRRPQTAQMASDLPYMRYADVDPRGHLNPGTPKQPRNASFGVAPLVNFSPE
ncbi:hypothetical protein OC861_005457 [Tilletia horrida]|nr:hypothetical protein OC861_005457 [Tilletia horrida]